MTALRLGIVVTGLMLTPTAYSEELRYAFTQVERLEYQSSDDRFSFDLQGAYGGDYHKLWWKLEGEDGAGRETELQLLYSRAVTPYFDLQLGGRVEDSDGSNELAFAIGLQGLAPYRIELDAAAFISEHGEWSLRAELERDVLLTQRWVLQPRIEIGIWLSDSTESNISSGDMDSTVELRLRYEWRRKFAPYIGVSWQDAATDAASTSVVAGLRFWF